MNKTLSLLLALMFIASPVFADSYTAKRFESEGETFSIMAQMSVNGRTVVQRVPIAGGDYSQAYVQQSLENRVKTLQQLSDAELAELESRNTEKINRYQLRQARAALTRQAKIDISNAIKDVEVTVS